jgi:hypothetical protein
LPLASVASLAALLSNAFLLVAKTFAQIFSCFYMAYSLNFLPHVGHSILVPVSACSSGGYSLIMGAGYGSAARIPLGGVVATRGGFF